MSPSTPWNTVLSQLVPRLQTLCPEFVATGSAFRTAKCALIEGTYNDQPAIAKTLGPRECPWSWYVQREIALYQQLRTCTTPIRVPSLLYANESERVMILSRFVGSSPLCSTRERTTPLAPATLTKLLHSIAQWRAFFLLDCDSLPVPTPTEHTALRDRLLEDPSAPMQWVREGLLRSVQLSLLDSLDVECALDALAMIDESKNTCLSHGDLLLRNVLQCSDGDLAWIDLECAGQHAQGWDLALLWVNVHDADREAIVAFAEQEDNEDSRANLRSFYACALFAIAREILYRSRARDSDRRSQRLIRDRAEVAQILRKLTAR